MARYTVLMTFETPGLRASFERKHSLRGPASSIRMLASEGRLAVTAAGVRSDSPADAALKVATEVGRFWAKTDGPLKVASWRADRERVLIGGRRRRGDVAFGTSPWPEGFPPGSSGWPGDDEGDAGDGSAGVREPRRPKPGPGSMSMEAELPDPSGG